MTFLVKKMAVCVVCMDRGDMIECGKSEERNESEGEMEQESRKSL